MRMARISRQVRRLWRVPLSAAVLVVLATCVGVAPASAHDELLDASPRAGASVSTPPTEVRLVFDEAVLPELSVVRVLAPDGQNLSLGAATVSGTVVTQRTSAAGPAGTYRLAFRVVSGDGHPVEGGWTFSVRSARSAGETTPAAGSPAAGTGDTSSSRLGLLAVVLTVVGGVASIVLRARVMRAQPALEAAV